MNKILKYWGEARGRAQQRKSPWNLALVLLSFICMGGIWYPAFKGMSTLQKHLIPADVIYSSPTNLGEILMMVPLFLPAIPLGMMLANFIAWCIPPARRILDREAAGIKGGSFKQSMKILSISSIVILIIVAPLSITGIFNYFYVTPKGVSIRTFFSQREKHYDWGDIVKIRGKFWDANHQPDAEYILYMRDGKKIDLCVHYLKFLDAYYKIKPFIRAQPQIVYGYDIRPYKNFHSGGPERFIKIIQNKD